MLLKSIIITNIIHLNSKLKKKIYIYYKNQKFILNFIIKILFLIIFFSLNFFSFIYSYLILRLLNNCPYGLTSTCFERTLICF
jgi:hypothetical protein